MPSVTVTVSIIPRRWRIGRVVAAFTVATRTVYSPSCSVLRSVVVAGSR